MMSMQFLGNLNRNLSTLTNYQDQMSTGRKINKPSDDPVGISFSMRYRSEISANEQYQKNISSATSWLDNTDTLLGQIGDVMGKVRDLTVQAATGSNPQSALDSIGKEVLQLTQQLTDLGNSQFNGKYVFNGQVTDKAPYDTAIAQDPATGDYTVNAQNSTTDTGDINVEITTGTVLSVNIPGNQIMGNPGDSDNAFTVLQNIMNALKKGDTQGLSNLLGPLDTRLNTMLQIRSDVGAKSDRVDLTNQRIVDLNTNLQSLQSKTEDVDMAALITNLQTSQNVYQASLAVGSKILPPSLVDFLR
jgi:flagellar hook-associated protein 3 FlgL